MNKDFYDWGIYLDKDLIGRITVYKQDEDKRMADLVWYLNANYRGKGYGNILFKEILKKYKEDFGYKKITLFPHKANQATIKIMLKNGGKIIGDFKEEKIIIEIPT